MKKKKNGRKTFIGALRTDAVNLYEKLHSGYLEFKRNLEGRNFCYDLWTDDHYRWDTKNVFWALLTLFILVYIIVVCILAIFFTSIFSVPLPGITCFVFPIICILLFIQYTKFVAERFKEEQDQLKHNEQYIEKDGDAVDISNEQSPFISLWEHVVETDKRAKYYGEKLHE